jgi:hypothetical protein
LIGANTVREVIVEGTQLIGTIVAHPCTASSAGNRKLDAVVYGGDTHLGIVFMTGIYTRQKGKEGNNGLDHLYKSLIIHL